MTTMSEGSSSSSSSSSSASTTTKKDTHKHQDSGIQSRPKRLIHYKKPDFSAEYMKHFGNGLLGDEDEDDEDFVLSTDQGSNKGDSESSSSESGDDVDNEKSDTERNLEPEMSQQSNIKIEPDSRVDDGVEAKNQTGPKKRRKRRVNKKFKVFIIN